MVVIFNIFTKTELSDDCKKLETIYILKIERDFIERWTPDGVYYDFKNLDRLQDAVKTLQQKYNNVKIKDKNNVLKQQNKQGEIKK